MQQVPSPCNTEKSGELSHNLPDTTLLAEAWSKNAVLEHTSSHNLKKSSKTKEQRTWRLKLSSTLVKGHSSTCAKITARRTSSAILLHALARIFPFFGACLSSYE